MKALQEVRNEWVAARWASHLPRVAQLALKPSVYKCPVRN